MKKIAVIGLGYVGLPLAVEFAKKRMVVGFDIKQDRVDELYEGHDPTLEVEDAELQAVLTTDEQLAINGDSQLSGLTLTTEIEDIKDAKIYIIAVPTPTDKNNRPDLTPLIKSSETVAKVLKQGDIVIYESTVYPGATEEDCVPVLENISGKKMNDFFFVGYSPERINPGDKVHTLTTIKKVTSGSIPEIGEEVDALYKEIIIAGTHLAPSIKVAEASKVIENSQRDINIAFVNELSKIFNRMGIDTLDVLEAAGTKWNFLNFRPGLVGGHCIGVDPFYLAQKAQEVGYHPEIILAGRRLNDSMGAHVAGETVKLMLKAGKPVKDAKALMLGITFKENCPDIRNTRAIDIYHELKSFGMDVDVYDPWAGADEVMHEYGIKLTTDPSTSLRTGNRELITENYSAIILAVAHNEFMEIDMMEHKENGAVIFDCKGILSRDVVDARL